MGSAFRRIYLDLETELADRLRVVVAASGKSQRVVIRDAVEQAVIQLEKVHGKSKK